MVFQRPIARYAARHLSVEIVAVSWGIIGGPLILNPLTRGFSESLREP